MYITKIIAKNFQLFEDITFTFQEVDLVTLIKGINKDVANVAGNGAGKSTILNAILFGLYGNVTGYTLPELLRLNCKKATVEIYFNHETNNYVITRTIPSSLEIIKNDEKLQFNTVTIAQNYLNILIGDNKHFLTYRMIDNKKGINLLDLGVVSLRKSLMDFVNNQFIEIRNKLLAKKLEREKYSKKFRPYTFCLSTKRQSWLSDGIKEFNRLLEEAKTKSFTIIQNINVYSLQLDKITQSVEMNINEISNINEQIKLGQNAIATLNKEIKDRELIKVFKDEYQYETEINKYKTLLENYDREIKSGNIKIENCNPIIKQTEEKITILKTQFAEKNKKIKKIEQEIEDLKILKLGTRCDKCGTQIALENKNQFISDKDFELTTLNEETYSLSEEIETNSDLLEELNKEINEYKTIIKEFQNKIILTKKTLDDLQQKEKEQLKQKEELTKQQLIIESKKEKISNYEEQIKKGFLLVKEKTIKTESLKKEYENINKLLIDEKQYLSKQSKVIEFIEKKIRKAESFLLKLNESFKFAEYKYNESDIELYNQGIKVLDTFSAYYINHWLENLSIILNDLLKEVNISIEFNMEKSFIKVKDNEQELTYNQLSSGQRTFLNTVFKIGILLNDGIMDGLLLIDEGLSDLDAINFKKLIPILKTLTFQSILIYQNVESNIPEVKYIIVERENGVSTIK